MRFRPPQDNRDVQRQLSQLVADAQSVDGQLETRFAPAIHQHPDLYATLQRADALEHMGMFLS